MSIKLRTVPGMIKKPGFIVPHAINLTAASMPNGEYIELESDKISFQVSYNDIEYLMGQARKGRK